MDKSRNVTGLVVGVILIAIGVISLLGNLFRFMNWDNAWPLIIIGIGAAFFIGMLVGGKTNAGLAVPGSIIITVGLILLYMNSFGRWEAWAYAWALIICGVGAGILINGYWSGRPDLRKQGLDTLRTGLILFLIFGVVMEFIFSVTGVSAGNLLLWSILLILLGLYLLVARLLRIGREAGGQVDLFWPIIMMGVGTIASLASLNIVPIGNLWTVLALWPLFLIVAGVGLLLRGRSPLVGALMGVLVVGILFVSAFAGPQLGLNPSPYLMFDIGNIQFGDASGERIIGSGNAITENRPVSGFDQVRMTIPGNLEIQQGASASLTATVEDNLLPYLVTDVRGNVLLIAWKPNTSIRTLRPVQIKLTVKDLQALESSSSGKVTVGPLATGDFRLVLSSSGNVEMNGIQADKITARLSSSGNATLNGSADQLDAQLSSSGSFRGDDLQVQHALVRISSSGNATLWVVGDLDANISSSGNVNYYGSPTVNQNTTSSGKVNSRGNK
jgi:hypothetical protein